MRQSSEMDFSNTATSAPTPRSSSIPDNKPPIHYTSRLRMNLADRRAGTLCSTEVPVVARTATVAECSAKMLRSGADCVLVEQEGQLCGIFTDNDMVRKMVSAELDPQATLVEAVMSSKVITIRPGCGILQAVLIMMDHKFRHMPVVNDGAPFGLLYMHHCIAAVLNQLRTTAQYESDDDSCSGLSHMGMIGNFDDFDSDSSDYSFGDHKLDEKHPNVSPELDAEGDSSCDADPSGDEELEGARRVSFRQLNDQQLKKRRSESRSGPSPSKILSRMKTTPANASESAMSTPSLPSRQQRHSAPAMQNAHATQCTRSNEIAPNQRPFSPPPSSFELLKILSKMTLRDIVRVAGREDTPSALEGCRVVDVVREMAQHSKTGAAILHARSRRLKGILTSKDVLRHLANAAGAADMDAYNKAATSKIYTPHPDTVPETMTVVEALEQMQQQGYTHLPVTSVGSSTDPYYDGGNKSALAEEEQPGTFLGIVDAMQLVTAILSTKDPRLSDNPKTLVKQMWELSTPPLRPRSSGGRINWSSDMYRSLAVLDDIASMDDLDLSSTSPADKDNAPRAPVGQSTPLQEIRKDGTDGRRPGRSGSESGISTDHTVGPLNATMPLPTTFREMRKLRKKHQAHKESAQAQAAPPTALHHPQREVVSTAHKASDVELQQLQQHQVENQPPPHQQYEDLLDYSLALNEHINRLERERAQQRSRIFRAASVGLVFGSIVSIAGGIFLGKRASR
eukprot:INCI10861.1.p1 GENE.INCI10861.1~~INCI10861.1.p1  ORF type:complete len:738 (+),score=138.47 INCI10861.1:153-2366(+)